jgi:hypothetical protein
MIYFIQQADSQYVKIGYTAHGLNKRLAALQIGNPHKLKALAAFSGSKADEAIYHNLYKHRAVRGEWFKLSAEDIAGIRQHHCNATNEKEIHHYCYRKPKRSVVSWFKHIMSKS